MRPRSLIVLGSVVGLLILASARDTVPGPRRQPEAPPSPSGHWETTVTTPDSVSHQVVLDLGLVGSHWAGEFDLPSFGVENYPVLAAVSDTAVDLEFTAMDVDFHGRMTADGDSLVGVAHHQDQEVDDFAVVFRRTGAAVFSDGFVQLETAAEDSSSVAVLPDDPEAFRTIFNRDAGRVRLVMLLAPS